MRDEDRQRVDAGALEQTLVTQLLHDQRSRLTERLHQADGSHLAQVTHQRGERHALQKGIPNFKLVEPLRWDSLARQIKIVDQTNNFTFARSLLGLFESFDDVRQLAGWA